MATVRAQRFLNTIFSNSLTSGQLQTALGTPSTLGDFQQVVNERGKARVICNSTVAFPIVANSAIAMDTLVSAPAGNAEFSRSTYATGYVTANPTIIGNSQALMNAYFANSSTRSTITTTRSMWAPCYGSQFMLNNWQYYISGTTWSGPNLQNRADQLTAAGGNPATYNPQNLSSANNVIFYSAYDPNTNFTGRLFSTTDGTTFTARLTPANSSQLFPRRVAFGNGLYVCVGQHWGNGNSYVWTSSDNVTWSSETLISGIGTFTDITFGNGVFVATTNAGIYTSTNGTTWTQRVSSSNYATVRTFDGTFFVATGGNGVLAYSTNGTSWTTTLSGTVFPSAGNRQWYRAAVGRNGQAVITGTQGWHIRTTNFGATWTGGQPSQTSWEVRCMDYANGLWIWYARDANELLMYRNTDLNSTAGWGSAIGSGWAFQNYDDSTFGNGIYMALTRSSQGVYGW